MPDALVVVQPFADYAKGDRITDPSKIEQTLKDHANRVVRVNERQSSDEEHTQ